MVSSVALRVATRWRSLIAKAFCNSEKHTVKDTFRKSKDDEKKYSRRAPLSNRYEVWVER